MADWEPFADWMMFRRLDAGSNIERAFSIAYKMTDDGAEMWSKRFDAFKAKNKEAIGGAVYVLQSAVPALVTALKIDPRSSVFVPALSSGETAASATRQIPIIAERCAKIVGARFDLMALAKVAHKPIHGIYNAADREAELDKASYVATKLGERFVFVFDDFITRGSTLARIVRAIQDTNGTATKVFAVSLAKTERRAFRPLMTNDHVPKKWDQLWQEGEEKMRSVKKGGGSSR